MGINRKSGRNMKKIWITKKSGLVDGPTNPDLLQND
jgi:hypothetical protein